MFFVIKDQAEEGFRPMPRQLTALLISSITFALLHHGLAL
jgi:hypothetical protein